MEIVYGFWVYIVYIVVDNCLILVVNYVVVVLFYYIGYLREKGVGII